MNESIHVILHFANFGSLLRRIMKLNTSQIKKFQKEALAAHNKYRYLHRVQPLEWSDVLAHSAKNWAKRISDLRTLTHQDLPDEGENLAFITLKQPDGGRITDIWYSESSNYDYDNPEGKLEVCHFTQVVWANTKEFGIYYFESGGESYVVAKYYPPGNITGQFTKNVFPPYKKSSEIINTQEELKNSDNLNKSCIGTVKAHDIYTNYKETLTADRFYVDNYNKEMLEWHNRARASHNVPPYRLNDRLKDKAQELAEKLLLHKIGKGEAPVLPGPEYGKSISSIVGRDIPDPRSICESWYAGSDHYDFKNPCFNYQNGGFTQMIWKNTKEVGFGVFWGDSRSIAVALYYPAGNINGKYDTNVFPINYLKQVTQV